MTRTNYTISLPYMFDPMRKATKYTFDNAHWLNAGQFMEIMVKYHMGFDYHKDANTPYDMGSDIPEIRASVKSSKATLTTKKLAPNMTETLDIYFTTCHSEIFMWAVQIDNELVIYTMNATEFREFIETWARFERGVVRFKISSGKMVRWLEERVG